MSTLDRPGACSSIDDPANPMRMPSFDSASSRLQQMLADAGHPNQLSWVFRDDLWLLEVNRSIVRWPLPPSNESIARSVYEQGRARGQVEVSAIVRSQSWVGTTVWFPKLDEEQVQGWSQGLKLSIRQPLASVELVSGYLWWLFRFNPRFRHFQAHCSFIETRSWAIAQHT